MSDTDEGGQSSSDLPSGICRGCLKESEEMINMYKVGLDVDFFKYTGIPNAQCEGMPEMLCATCEADLKNTKRFKDQCQESDVILKLNLEKNKTIANSYQVTSILIRDKLIQSITAPNPSDKIHLKCIYDNCDATFNKYTFLCAHLKKSHGASPNLDIEQRFYCTEDKCIYNQTSTPNRHFSGRKFLNQHMNKTHREKLYACDNCQAKFSTESAYYRHIKTCKQLYLCTICHTTYATNETYLVHLSRKHPTLHVKYKQEKAIKRLALNNNKESVPSKKIKLDQDTIASVAKAKYVIQELPRLIRVDKTKSKKGKAANVTPLTVSRYKSNINSVPEKPNSYYTDTKTENTVEEDNEESLTEEAVRLVEAANNGCFDVGIADDEDIIQEEVIEENCEDCIDNVDVTEENEMIETEYVNAQPSHDPDTTHIVQENDMFKIEHVNEEDENVIEIEYVNAETCMDSIDIGQEIDKEAIEIEYVTTQETTDISQQMEEENNLIEIEYENDETCPDHSEEVKDIIETEYEMESPFKKSSATQIPEHITNDVSLNSWDNKNVFEIQTDEMSTQTVFEDLLRSQQDDIFFSESVSLSDIQTQTVPLEFGLTQNKGTQSQPPGLSFKETQTSADLFDVHKRNFKFFDSRSSSPAPSYISNAQTQTIDARGPIRSDVLLSFSSAETQTDDFRYSNM